MIAAKSGEWWLENGQRSVANNSAVALRHRITREQFDRYIMLVEENGSGEPGIYFSNDQDALTNPCCETNVSLNFCNLSTMNFAAVESQQDVNDFARAAAFIGTLQAGYTDFHYLRPIWQERTEREALLGVSMTGLARGDLDRFDFRQAAGLVRDTNVSWAERIGINPAYRLTSNKPEGTSSAVLQTSSGVHAWHDRYFLRRTRYVYDSPVVRHIRAIVPHLVEPDRRNPKLSVVSLPCRAPDRAITRSEPMSGLLERIGRLSREWVRAGHRKGANSHSVSATVSVEDGRWAELRDWMWHNRHDYNGLAVLPHDGGTYEQAPFESIDGETYYMLAARLPSSFNLHRIHEAADTTARQQEAACASGVCTI
jgi:ribonucleoside-diphosphate reductase alpha chain